MDESSGDGNALLLSTGELFGTVVHPVFESHGSENRFGFSQLLSGRELALAQFESHPDILRGCQGFKKIMSLEDKTHLTSKLLHGSRSGSNERLT